MRDDLQIRPSSIAKNVAIPAYNKLVEAATEITTLRARVEELEATIRNAVDAPSWYKARDILEQALAKDTPHAD